jgi:hypothetical protein
VLLLQATSSSVMEDVRERATRLLNEIHGVAAQLVQKSSQSQPQPVSYSPLTESVTGRDVERERQRTREAAGRSSSGVVERVLGWLGYRPYVEQVKREDGVHTQRRQPQTQAYEAEVDEHKAEYLRSEAAKRKAVDGEEEEEEAEDAGLLHRYRTTLLDHLLQLKTRFSEAAQRVKHSRQRDSTAAPRQQQQQHQPQAARTAADNDGSGSVPVAFTSSSSSHPLHELSAIMRDVESWESVPLLPAPPSSLWQRFVSAAFPSALERRMQRWYRQAGDEAREEAGKLSAAMRSEYDALSRQLQEAKRDIAAAAATGDQPLELLQQYDPDSVTLEEKEAVTKIT